MNSTTSSLRSPLSYFETYDCGIHTFMRRDNPELWAMAQAHITRTWRYRLFELVVLTKEQTWRETKWKLFGVLPVWRVKEALTKIL